MTNVKSLLELYVKMGGSLTDTYSDIAGGVPVGQYSTISDAILACSKKYSSGGGGGAEKFVVTLTQDEQTEEWAAADGVTVAEIAAAYEANKIVVAEIPYNNEMLVDVPCLAAAVIDDYGTQFGTAVFVGNLPGDTDEAQVAYINGFESDGSDRWEVSTNNLAVIIPNGSNEGDLLVWDDDHDKWKAQSNPNAPLIVTMTAGQEEGSLIGDKTYKEVFDAMQLGIPVSAVIQGASATRVVDAFLAEGNYYLTYSSLGSGTPTLAAAAGSANEYISFTVGN